MEEVFELDQTFKNLNKDGLQLTPGDYENCTFQHCNFGNTDLSNCKFSECTFTECNLSLAKIKEAAFRDVVFNDCKLLGLRFETCNKFALVVRFERCILNDSSFYQLSLKNTTFSSCQMHAVDFVETDLTGSKFDDCDLLNAVFESTIMEKVDLLTAVNYRFDPDLNRIKKAKLSVSGLAGLLDKYNLDIRS